MGVVVSVCYSVELMFVFCVRPTMFVFGVEQLHDEISEDNHILGRNRFVACLCHRFLKYTNIGWLDGWISNNAMFFFWGLYFKLLG